MEVSQRKKNIIGWIYIYLGIQYNITNTIKVKFTFFLYVKTFKKKKGKSNLEQEELNEREKKLQRLPPVIKRRNRRKSE